MSEWEKRRDDAAVDAGWGASYYMAIYDVEQAFCDGADWARAEALKDCEDMAEALIEVLSNVTMPEKYVDCCRDALANYRKLTGAE